MKSWENCTRAQKIERWENCLRVLRALSPHERKKHWNMGLWAEKTACGMGACAAGHCALDPWFRRRGFKVSFVLDEGPSEDYPNGIWSSVWAGEDGLVPTTEFFGNRGCGAVFHNGRDRQVSQVIKEVKAHIKWLKTSDEESINY